MKWIFSWMLLTSMVGAARATAHAGDGNAHQNTLVNYFLLDVHKGKDRAKDNHGRKIVVVVPFGGPSLDRDLQKAIAEDGAATARESGGGRP